MLSSTYPPIYITLAPGELKLKLRDSNLGLQGCLGNFDQPLNRGGLFEVAICFIRQIFLHHLNPLLPAIKRCCYIYMRAFLSPSINVPIGLYDRLPSLISLSVPPIPLSRTLFAVISSLSHTHTSPPSLYSWILPGKVFIRRFVRLGPILWRLVIAELQL